MAMRALKLYTSDDGNQYRVLIPIWLSAIASPSFGFAADDASKGFLPRGMVKRYVTAKDPVSLRHRKVHVGAVTAAGWTTLSTAVTMPNIDGTSTVYTTDGRVGEKLRAP